MSANLMKSFDTLINSMFTRYKGVLIEKHNGKYIALNKSCESLEAAQTVIDNAFSNIKIN